MTAQDGPAIGTKYPLLFNYRDTLFGRGFIVEVQAVNGRALCVRESDEYWIYGVNPGGMAAYGETPQAAHTAFRKTFTRILVDLARDSESFEGFQRSVQTFFDGTNPGYETEWQDATLAVRRGEVTLEGVALMPANSPRTLVVSLKQVEQVTPQDKYANVDYLLAA